MMLGVDFHVLHQHLSTSAFLSESACASLSTTSSTSSSCTVLSCQDFNQKSGFTVFRIAAPSGSGGLSFCKAICRVASHATSKEATSGFCESSIEYEVEETFKRVASHKGVLGTMIMSSMGIPLKSTMDAPTTLKHAVFLGPLAAKAKHMLHSIDASQELTLLRARSIDREVIIVPQDDFVIIILQNVSHK
ncbi:hypothetical protein L7F22_011548 [Adiantum nelumboides]|nr:hypothetical protein [Adiantum nelumboides]